MGNKEMKILNFIKNIWEALKNELPEAKSFGKSCGESLAFFGSLLCVFWIMGWIAEQFIPESIFTNSHLFTYGHPGTLGIGAMVTTALFLLMCAIFATLNAYVALKKIWDKS